MKSFLFRVTGWAIAVAGLMGATEDAQAQSASATMIKAGKYNANQYFKAYFQPGGEAFGHALNSGWFNSAKAMGLGRFDVRVYGSVTLTSEEDRTFDLANAGFDEHVRLGSNTTAPTVFGIDEAGPQITVLDDDGKAIGRFNAPEGSGVVLAPAPMAQVSLGLIKDTEIAVRFIPEVHVQDYKGKLWGIGLKHGVKQWIPGLRLIPGFDLAAVGGYTSFETTADINVLPLISQTPERYEGQELVVKTKAWMAGLMASKTISVLTGYAGVRYSKSTTDVNLNGRYFVDATSEDLVNPVAVDMGHGQLGINAGLRLKLGFLSFFGEYTIADYSTASAGIGVGLN